MYFDGENDDDDEDASEMVVETAHHKHSPLNAVEEELHRKSE